MRKLLMASAALASGMLGVAGNANAQAYAPIGALVNVPTTGVPAPLNPRPYGAAPGTAVPGPTAPPSSITVRLNFNIWVDAGVVSDSGDRFGGGKEQKYAIQSFARAYPGMDGIASNGMKYGAQLEIRNNSSSAPGGGNSGSASTGNLNAGYLYWRRITGYLGADNVGFFRFGSTDQPTSLFLTGTFENFDEGGLNGDLPGFFNGAVNPGGWWPFQDVGSLYTPQKIVYVSPQLAGFDIGLMFNPDTGVATNGNGNCNAANAGLNPIGLNLGANGGGATGCDRLASTSINGEQKRRRNYYEAMIRYRGSFGPVGVAATAAYMGSGLVANGGIVGAPNPVVPAGAVAANLATFNTTTSTAAIRYNPMNIGDFGLQVTFGGLAVGGHAWFGTGQQGGTAWNPSIKGSGASTAWLVGASYTTGPFIVGAHFVDYVSPGAKNPFATNGAQLAGREHDVGLAVGGTWNYAPGMNFYVSYIYTQRHETGFDFLAGSATGSPKTNNNVKGQAFMVGSAFRW